MKWGGAAPLPLSAVDKLTAVSDDQTMAKNGLARIVISRGLTSGCYLVNTEHSILWKRPVRMPTTTLTLSSVNVRLSYCFRALVVLSLLF